MTAAKSRIRIKPTLRRNGMMMFPMRIEFIVGRHDLISIGTMKLLNEDPLPETRGEWLELLTRHLREWGAAVTPDYLTNESHSMADIQNAKRLASAVIGTLFPDLSAP